MEVLQKITIYDLLGYTVPGTIMVGVLEVCFFSSWLFDEEYENYLGYICGVTILLGYVLGMVIAEITSLIYEKVWKKVLAKINRPCQEGELNNLGKEVVTKALIQAGIIENGTELSPSDIEKYYSYMYADIQSDPKYARVHNYASSELVCKNTAFVLLISSILCIFRKNVLDSKNENAIAIAVIVVVGILGGFILFLRYLKQKNRKNTYTLDWFVQKHIGNH